MKQFSSTVAKIKNASGEYEPIPALRGATPYEIAKKNGFEGTEEEWYNLSFDEGWVTKYQELEASKANKADVYNTEQIDVLLQGLDTLKEKEAKYVPLWDALVGKSTNLSYSVLAISPNRQYLCRLVYAYRSENSTSGFTIELCRTEDMSVVQSYELDCGGSYSYPHVDMDDDFIALCYSNTQNKKVEYAMSTYSYAFQFNSVACYYSWKFFTYNDTGMTEVSVSGFSPHNNYGRLPIFYPVIRDDISGGSNFWFLTEEQDINDTNVTRYMRLYNIDKSTKITTKKREWSIGDAANNKYKIYQYKYYRDGDDVIVTYRGNSNNSICVDRMSITSQENICTITDPGYGWAVDVKSSQVVTIGDYGIRVYGFDGVLSHETSVISWSDPKTDAVSIDVLDGHLYIDNVIVDLTTLNVMSNIYASIDPLSPILNGGTLAFEQSIPVTAVKTLVNDGYISTIISPNSSTYKNEKSTSGPILGVNLAKMQIGGYLNE